MDELHKENDIDPHTKEKNMIHSDIIMKIVEKTIGFDIGSGIKPMSPEESYEWHKKHARIDKDGNMIISSDEIGDGSYEKKYKKP